MLRCAPLAMASSAQALPRGLGSAGGKRRARRERKINITMRAGSLESDRLSALERMLLLRRKLEQAVEEEDYERASQLQQSLDSEAIAAGDDGSALSLVKSIRELSSSNPSDRLAAARRIADADRVDPRAQPALLQALWDDDEIATLAEKGLLRCWEQNDDSSKAEQELAAGSRLMQEGKLDAAQSKFDSAIFMSPSWAEARNKRATVLYIQSSQAARTGAEVPHDTLRECIEECNMVIELEPHHFGALSGLGLARLLGDEKAAAVRAFESALSVNPRLRIARLKQRVEKELGKDRES